MIQKTDDNPGINVYLLHNINFRSSSLSNSFGIYYVFIVCLTSFFPTRGLHIYFYLPPLNIEFGLVKAYLVIDFSTTRLQILCVIWNEGTWGNQGWKCKVTKNCNSKSKFSILARINVFSEHAVHQGCRTEVPGVRKAAYLPEFSISNL